MEFFDSGHLASGLGDLDAVADEDGLEVDAKEAWVEPEDQSAPGVGELVQIQGRAMEEVQEPVVAGRLQAQSAHDAGDAEQIFASGESGQAEGHPQEGAGACAGGAQFAHRIQQIEQRIDRIKKALLEIGPMRPGSLRNGFNRSSRGLIGSRRRYWRSVPCVRARSEEHTSELQSLRHLVCRLLLEKKKKY